MRKAYKGRGDKVGFTYNFDYTQVTTSTTVDNTIPEQWSKDLEDYVKARRFMARFAIEKTELIKEEGDTINIFRRQALTNTGNLSEGTQLVGTEEKMEFDKTTYTPAERGNAVSWTGQANAKSIFELRKEAQFRIGDWAANKIDADLHTSAQAVVQRIYGGGKANMSLLASGDKLTPDLITKAKYYLRKRNVLAFNAKTGEAQPGSDKDGMYVMVVRPEQMYDLSIHSDYKTAASQLAAINAQTSDVFSGFKGYWDGVLIYDSTNAYFANPGGYSVSVAKGLMFGPRFMGRANGIFKTGPGFTWAEEMFDYGRTMGIAVRYYDHCKLLNPANGVGVFTAATAL